MPGRVFQLKVPAEAGCLKAVRAFVTAMLGERLGDDADRLVLALDEACSNVVRHRSEALGCRDIEVTVELTQDLFRCRIGAFCAERDVPKVHPRGLADARPGGIGTQLISRIMDRIDYEPDPDRPGAMSLVLEKRLPPAPGS
jgi:anti-sigma regulatory factor (Ser/Thr protein kinase)